MKTRLRTLCLQAGDIILAPIVFGIGSVLRELRRLGFNRFPLIKRALLRAGIFPIRNHYYDPLFDAKSLSRPLSVDRRLPGIDWNIAEQLKILAGFNYKNELRQMEQKEIANGIYFKLRNAFFTAGDAEYWYSIIRWARPRRIVEIGSGQSTLVARLAIMDNGAENAAWTCEHTCVEPYEAPWLEKLGIRIVREKVERLGTEFFGNLMAGDILFIDSSHMIRPQGDVTYEILELLPRLNAGVIVHIHDIFSPRDYPASWLFEHNLFWNEQYLLEAFLTQNKEWSIIAALNLLRNEHSTAFAEKCVDLRPEDQPASFYIRKNR
jgi:hypothetical protein